MKYKLVIFDWQGTLTDLSTQYAQQFCLVADKVGLPKVTIEQVKQLMHLDLCYLIQTLYPEPAFQTQRSALLDNFSLYRMHHAHDVCIYAGVKTLLLQLREQGAFLAIATASSLATLLAELNYTELKEYFDAYKTPDHTLCKPAPDMLNELMAEFDVEQSETVMIGDSRCDFDAANNAGVDFIGIHLASETLSQDILAASAFVVTDVSELYPLLNS